VDVISDGRLSLPKCSGDVLPSFQSVVVFEPYLSRVGAGFLMWSLSLSSRFLMRDFVLNEVDWNRIFSPNVYGFRRRAGDCIVVTAQVLGSVQLRTTV
jgi:hypothetical protein